MGMPRLQPFDPGLPGALMRHRSQLPLSVRTIYKNFRRSRSDRWRRRSRCLRRTTRRQTEPPAVGSPLRDLPNVVLSPHQGYDTPESLECMLDVVVANMENYLAGSP